jgi:hypothetical protein
MKSFAIELALHRTSHFTNSMSFVLGVVIPSAYSAHHFNRMAFTTDVNLGVNRVNLTFLDLRLPDWRGGNYPRSFDVPEGPKR